MSEFTNIRIELIERYWIVARGCLNWKICRWLGKTNFFLLGERSARISFKRGYAMAAKRIKEKIAMWKSRSSSVHPLYYAASVSRLHSTLIDNGKVGGNSTAIIGRPISRMPWCASAIIIL